ncbi:MAG: D-alanine--D-alanine ligase [Caulobacter vibrioides]|uniref:D-alanine--D-alanine ligase n=1 Tax=Caulobacter vibrioides TaxID=155892 RepID=A0A258D0N6_CAUVI|nr:MAG: D-alanine--D-alanine ligase [Caulobacter vibrioides]
MTQQPLSGRHIAVLLGGPSSERKVSLVSGAVCAEALERLGAKVSRIDPGLASALAMDKAKAKAVLAAAGVTVPGGGLFNRHDVARDHVLQPPYVVKPNAEGSSVGVFIVHEGANRPPEEVGAPSWTFGEEVMVEPYIQGMELAVAVLGESSGPRALAVTDIRASTGFYDYEAKYSEGGSIHVLPAPIPNAVRDRAMRMAELAHTALGCRGVTRSDFRYDDINDLLVLLEVNTQPGMTPTSLAPEQADHVGIPFDHLVLWIVEDAYARCSAGGTA